MKIICIGRNYIDHAKELNNPVPKQPLVFMKPSSALLVNNKPLYYPKFTKNLHYEAEIVLKICKNGRHVQPAFAKNYYNEIALGIDFTARDIQRQCKEKGHPWEIAKAWNHSAAIGEFIPIEEAQDQDGHINFSLTKNSAVVQEGITSNMLTGFDDLIVYLSKYFMLLRGDVIFTGTPKGVGAVQVGDTLEGFIDSKSLLKCRIK